MTKYAGHGNFAVAPYWKIVCELIVLHIWITSDVMLMIVSVNTHWNPLR